MLIRHKSRAQNGLTLIEVMLTMTIFSAVAMGIVKSSLMVRYQAEFMVYQNTAFSAVQSYVEQLKNIPYSDLKTSMDDNSIGLPTKSISYSQVAYDSSDTSNNVVSEDDPLYIGSSNDKSILVDIDFSDENNPKEIRMDLFVTVTLNDLNSSGTGLNATEVILDYSYNAPHVSGHIKLNTNNSVRFIRAELQN